ncbi:MAG: hypothetical protein KatS3mg031_0368 [Chitinophagales bacterium]|nr:MAG: hypothetical protein KatS3mg031_0368 [Chitinophagales bacterium]
MRRKFIIRLVALLVMIEIVASTSSCKKEKEASGLDKQLLDMAVPVNGFVWYKYSDALLNRSAGSGHNYPFLRTRYNSVAATVLDSSGKIIPGNVFPEGSLIVKELYSNSSTLSRYAMLYKKAGDPNADASGWIWGYVNADGTVAQAASLKGSGCRGCHSQPGHIDFNLMTLYFP